MIYNTKIITYPDGKVQVKFYSKDIHVSDSISEKIQEARLQTIQNNDSSVTDPDLLIYQSKSRTIQNIYNIARSNIWDYFVTFTFNEKRVNRQSYEDCYQALKRYCNYIKKLYCPDLKYFFVPELHSDGISYHFHGLFANCLDLPVVKALNKDNDPLLDKKGRFIFNSPDYIYGFCTLTRIDDNFAVISYMSKYITKNLCDSTVGKNRYFCSQNVNRPQCKVACLSSSELDSLLIRSGIDTKYVKTIGDDDNQLSIFEIDSKLKDFYDGFHDVFFDWDDL